jgi:hypothetical protein
VKGLMNATLLTLALVFALGLPANAHEQRFMGTVDSIEGAHLQITTTDGKSIMVMLDEKTRILQGKVAKRPADVKAGGRVVVTTIDGKDKQGKPMLLAKQVMLGTSASAPKK